MAEQPVQLTAGPRDEDSRTLLAGPRLPLYGEVWQQLGPLEVPVFLHAENPHERLFVAALDGTGNDFIRDPRHATNVGLIYDQISKSSDDRITAKYVEGTGTQPQWLTRLTDGARGYTADERAEQMYKLFIDQARLWIRDDRNVKISIASVGFSRGAEEVALFGRIVEERGIQDPSGATYTYDEHHQIKHVVYTRPALIPPGQTAHAVALFDPVATGQPMHADRRPPPSVISGIQLIAMDDRRRLFRSDHIIDPGITMDGRFAGFNVPGAHCDVGGSCLLNGLSNRAGNFVIAYLNALSDRPYLQRLPETDDPQRNVIHRSEDGMFLYGADYKVDRSTPDGYNELLVDRKMADRVPDPNNAEPRNEALNAQFEHQTVSHAAQAAMAGQSARAAPTDLDKLIDRLYQGALRNDARAMDAAADDYLRTSDGQFWQQQVMRRDQALQLDAVMQGPAVQQAAQQPAVHQALLM